MAHMNTFNDYCHKDSTYLMVLSEPTSRNIKLKELKEFLGVNQKSCKNCSAPLKKGKSECEYCGSGIF
jgi:hypothetical protein